MSFCSISCEEERSRDCKSGYFLIRLEYNFSNLSPGLMSKQKPRYTRSPAPAVTPFEEARDEMFQHIMKCGVIGASADDQKDWFDATMAYIAERYHELSPKQVSELRVLGERFSQPAKVKAAV